MKARTIALTFVMCFVGLTVCFADNANMGSWKLNESKSKLPSAARNTMVMYEAVGDNVKVTIDGVDAQGKPTHTEWTGKFDGKDYPVTGDSTSDSRSYKEVSDHDLNFTAKKDGKVTLSGKISVSKDGKTRTVTANGTDAMGKKMHTEGVYDKQ
jgi:hypothetical protein